MIRLQYNKSHTRAFTLIEMVVATLLLAIGVVSALICISSATRASIVASQYRQAVRLAQQRIAEMESQPDSISSGDSQGDFGSDSPGYRWKQTAENTDFTNVLKVTLTVQWDNGVNGRSIQIVTYEQNTPLPNSQTGSATTTSSIQ